MSKEEITELDEEYVEVTPDITFDLGWTCPNCGQNNVEYDIPIAKTIECNCEKCGKKYEYFYDPY